MESPFATLRKEYPHDSRVLDGAGWAASCIATTVPSSIDLAIDTEAVRPAKVAKLAAHVDVSQELVD